MIEIIEVYNDWLDHNQEQRKKEFKHLKKYFSASSAGSCYKKNIFKLFGFQEKEIEKRSKRLLRLGTIIHEDFEKAMEHYIKTRSDDVSDDYEFFIEKEILLKDLNVRGFYDLVAVSQHDGSVYLIDFKTMASFSWSKKFGYKNFDANPSMHQEIQLATYGLHIREEFGRLDGMFLYYYNKDTSRMKAVEVSMSMLKRAENYWVNINNEHKKGLPMFREGASPVQDWECKYCSFLDHCNPPFFKKK